MRNLNLFSCFLIILFVFGCAPKEKYDLLLNLEVGKTYTIEQETNQLFEQKLMGINMEMKHRFNVVYDLQVKNYENEIYLLDFEYNSITMNVEGSGINMAVSSEPKQNTDDTLSLIFKAFTGKSFTVGISNTGRVDFIEGIDEFFDLVVAELGFIVKDEELEAINAFDQFIGKGGFKDNISQLTNYFPGKPVSVGQKWENAHIQSNMGFVGKWENHWQLKDIDESTAKVNGTSKFSILHEDEVDDSGGLMFLAQYGMDVKMEGEQEVEHLIDRSTGLIKKGKVQARMDGVFLIGEGESGMNMPISFEITSIVRRVK